MVARAKGLTPGTILRDYLVRNALTPVITVTGLQVASLLGGSILVETIFAIPGMGQYLFDSITSRDYPVIQAIVLVAAAIVRARQHAGRHRLCAGRCAGEVYERRRRRRRQPIAQPHPGGDCGRRNGAILLGLGLVMLAVDGDRDAASRPGSRRSTPRPPRRIRWPDRAREHWLGTDLDRPRRAEPAHHWRPHHAADHHRRGVPWRWSPGSCSACSRVISAGLVDEVVMRVLDVVFAFPVFLLAIAVVAALGPTRAEPHPDHRDRLHAGHGPGGACAGAQRQAMGPCRGGPQRRRQRVRLVVSAMCCRSSFRRSWWRPASHWRRRFSPSRRCPFLGMGPPPPDPNWGGMLSEARQFMELAPLTVIGPAAAIVFATLTFIVLANGLREVLRCRRPR